MGSQIEKFFESNEKNEDITNDSNNDDNNNNNQLNEKFNDFKFIQFYKSTGSQDNFNWSVAHVRSLLTKKEYAMKKIQGIQQLQYYNEEMNILRNLDHPYIIKYYNLFVYNNDCYLLMEFMNNSDIENFIEVNKLYEYDPEEEI
jgi:serine/threonine protein kinase